MNKSESIVELAKALAAFQGEAKNPPNTAENPHFKSRYAPLSEILNSVRPVLAKHGLSVIQSPGGDGDMVSMTTLLLHSSGEWVMAGPLTLKADKPTAQGAGSGITYARRYSLSAVLGISSEDDDDGNQANKTENKKSEGAPKQATPPKQASSADRQELPPARDIPGDALICHKCEADITKAHKAMSMHKFKQPLCPKCAKELEK